MLIPKTYLILKSKFTIIAKGVNKFEKISIFFVMEDIKIGGFFNKNSFN
jgi:hypothetical protein